MRPDKQEAQEKAKERYAGAAVKTCLKKAGGGLGALIQDVMTDFLRNYWRHECANLDLASWFAALRKVPLFQECRAEEVADS